MRRSISYRFVLAVVLLAAVCAAGAVRAAEIILYRGTDFLLRDVPLTQSTPDLGDFDNLANSVKVISGTWILYHNADYGETPELPSLTLTPGDYPSLVDAGFPIANGLSSVRWVPRERPTTPPGGFQTCTPPYRIALGQRCLWTCGPNSSPDEARNRCSCNNNYVARGTDSKGRVRCLPSRGTVVQPRTQRYTVPGAIALGIANRNGFRTDTEAFDANCTVAGHLVITKKKGIGLRVPECRVNFFNRRSLAPGWRMVDAQVQFARPRAANPAFPDGHCGESICQLAGSQQMPPIRLRALKSVQLLLITLEGPAGRNWVDAFARQ